MPKDTSRAAAKPAKAKKDPNAPKRPLSAYMFFSQDQRTTVKDENPDASFGQSDCFIFGPSLDVRARGECRSGVMGACMC